MFSEQQMVEMTMELDSIVELITATQKILDEEKEAGNVVPINNVIQTDFFILAEFERLKQARLRLPQVLAVYHDWAERTFNLATQNRGRLRKGKLRRYVESCIAQVQTIQQLLPNAPINPPTME